MSCCCDNTVADGSHVRKTSLRERREMTESCRFLEDHVFDSDTARNASQLLSCKQRLQRDSGSKGDDVLGYLLIGGTLRLWGYAGELRRREEKLC
jgi:hypothetical protein